METICSSEISVASYKATRHLIQEDTFLLQQLLLVIDTQLSHLDSHFYLVSLERNCYDLKNTVILVFRTELLSSLEHSYFHL
jgi:hypothetical protein